MAGGEENNERRLDSSSLLNLFTRTLECPLCFDSQKELKILTCCDKLICSPCLDGLFDKEKNRQLQDGAPLCPMCQQEMTLKPEQYPLNKLAQHLQTYTQTLKRAVEKGSTDKCQSVNCKRDVDMYCKSCKILTCYRCKDKRCKARDDVHDAVDVTSCVDGRKEDFNLWRSVKEREIQEMKDERDKICSEVKKRCQELVTWSADHFQSEIEKTTLFLTSSRQEIQGLNVKISRESSSLQLMVDSTERVGEIEFIHLVSQLNIYEENREIKLGEYEPMMKGVECFDVLVDKRGRLVVGKGNELDIVDVSSGEVKKSLSFDGDCASLQLHGDNIVLSVVEEQGLCWTMSIVTLNSEYEEINRWSASMACFDFTVLADRIYVTTGASRPTRDIEVFSFSGERLSSILWNGDAFGISVVAPHSIVFSDRQQHRVYKRKSKPERGTEWTADVKAPRCLCADDRGLIWVISRQNDSLTILNKNGKRHQKELLNFQNDNKLGDINGLRVWDDYLYVAHVSGVGRFPIAYQ